MSDKLIIKDKKYVVCKTKLVSIIQCIYTLVVKYHAIAYLKTPKQQVKGRKDHLVQMVKCNIYK